MNKMGKTLILMILVALFLVACSGGFGQENRLDGTAWLLTHIRDNPVLAGSQPSLRFEAGQASGQGSCNGFGGEYTQSGGSLSFGSLMSTMMACEPMEIMAQEQAYLAALGEAAGFTMEGQSLQILDAEGVTILSFLALDTSIEGKTWQMISYNDEELGGLVPVLSGTTVTAQFKDGTLTGSSGCNQYSAAYTLEEENLSVGPAGGTEMYCMDPAGVMEQERGYLDALPRSASFRVEGGRLTLMDAGGSIIAEFIQIP